MHFGYGKIARFTGNGAGLLSGFVLGVGVGFFVSGVRLGFRLLGGRVGLYRVWRNLEFFFLIAFVVFFVFVRALSLVLLVSLVFFFVLFEFRATDYGVDMSVFGSFLVFGFDEFGRKGSNLVVVEIDIATDGRLGLGRMMRSGKHQRSDFLVGFVALVGNSSATRFFFGSGAACGYALFGEEPARQSAREAARAAGWCAGGGCGSAGLCNRRHVHGATG